MSEHNDHSHEKNHRHGENHNVTQSGAIYFYKVDKKVHESEIALLKASEVLAHCGLSQHTYQLVRIYKEDHVEVLADNDVIDLNNYGVEEFRTEKRLVEVFYKDNSFKIHAGETKVVDLKKALGVPQAHHLSVLVHQELKPLSDDGTICITGGERFVSYPCDGKAS